MSVNIIDTLKQMNGGEFPIVDSNDVSGGYYQVGTVEEMNAIPDRRKKIGMLCFVEEQSKIYQWIGSENDTSEKDDSDNTLPKRGWIEFKIGGSELDVYFGELEPEDGLGDETIWFNSIDFIQFEYEDNPINKEIKSSINMMNKKLASLESRTLELEMERFDLFLASSSGSITNHTDLLMALRDIGTRSYNLEIRVVYLKTEGGSDGANTDKIIPSDDTPNGLMKSTKELINKILWLEKQITLMESVTSVSSGDEPGIGEEDLDYILLEDGSILLLEDGSEFLLETSSTPTSSNNLLLEDGGNLLLEDGSLMLLE